MNVETREQTAELGFERYLRYLRYRHVPAYCDQTVSYDLGKYARIRESGFAVAGRFLTAAAAGESSMRSERWTWSVRAPGCRRRARWRPEKMATPTCRARDVGGSLVLQSLRRSYPRARSLGCRHRRLVPE